MNWPWDELGLDGPCSLEEIHKAYAKRTKETHPEEDPKGFQRLHQAYQTAKKIARITESKNSSYNKPKEKDSSVILSSDPLDVLDEQDVLKDDKTEQADKKASSEGSSFKEEWDYDKIFNDAVLEKENKMRKELQKLSGFTDDEDEWDLVIPAIRQLYLIEKDPNRSYLLLNFLDSPLFEEVRGKETFILALEIWIKRNSLLNSDDRKVLLEHLDIPADTVPVKYKKIYNMLSEPTDTVYADSVYYYQGSGKKEKKKKKKRIKPIVIAFLCYIIVVFAADFIKLNPPSNDSCSKRQIKEMTQWINEDMGLTLYQSQTDKPAKGMQVRFRAKEMPQFSFLAEYEGKRDLSKGNSGYITDFSISVFDRNIRHFAAEHGYQISEKGNKFIKSDSILYNYEPVYFLEFPLSEAESCIYNLDEFLKSMKETSRYKDMPPKYSIHFTRSGISYFQFESFNKAFDPDIASNYCRELAPANICKFILQKTGMDEFDFSSKEYSLFQLEQTVPYDSPDFYFLFAAIDTHSKDVLRLYAYSDIENTLISFPAEEFKENISFNELEEKSSPFYGAKKMYMEFPKMLRQGTDSDVSQSEALSSESSSQPNSNS